MPLILTIDRQLEEPVYEQVAGQIRRLIVAGDLEPGATLPSVRQLARDLGVGLNTIARAYRLLEEDGFLEIRNRAGATVAAPSAVESSARAPVLDSLRGNLERLWQMGMDSEEMLKVLRLEVHSLGGKTKGDNKPKENRDG